MGEIKENEILTEEELRAREASLLEREESLNKKERELSILEATIVGTKYNLYDRIRVSLKTMDIIILLIIIALVIAIIAGILTR